MAEALLQVLIKNLSSLIEKEIGSIMSVDEEMKKLSSTLTTIQKVLEDAEDKQLQSEPIQNWLSKLKDIAYETEDIVDECATEVSKLKHKGKFNLKKILLGSKIGRRVKKMAKKLDAVAEERHKFHLREKDVSQSREVDAGRKTGSILNEPDHIYGRDEDKEKIVDMLVNQVTDCQQLSVLPIIGIGGLGKTTLAQLVYKDERVTQHFDIKLWVCVSDNFDVELLLKEMIASATGRAPDSVPLDVLQRRILEELNQKRYLLILDDVWNEDQESWAKLKSILACGSKGASVIVTTRPKIVADIMGTLPAHCLTSLSEEHCWLLFKLRAFGRENEEHPNLENIGRQIVKKCAGVPLAAKALGGLLRFKRREEEWIHVKESEIWNFPEEKTSILPALRLSYRHLPLTLRRCFVYCAVFPKDTRIEKQDLIFHWMAHGCISSNKNWEVEDVGDQILNELVLRSFFQEVEVDTIRSRTTFKMQDLVHTIGRRQTTTFKMHDLVHDLAQSIMENKIPGAQIESSSGSASNSKIREVHFCRHPKTSPSSITLQVSALTTIMNYNRLRILKTQWGMVEEVPSAIGKLKHLRYLNLVGSKIRTLPNTFCGLWNLQILVLNYCYHLKSLPKHIRYMTNLRHIFLEECWQLSDMPSRIGELTSLKTLSLFIVGHKKGNQVDELELLNLGEKLEIQHLERIQDHLTAKKANLVEKPNLRDLVLCWGVQRWDWAGPGRIGPFDNFTQSTSELDEKVLEALEPHPNLETLGIGGFKGRQFPLWMTKMENVTGITIRNCPNCSRCPLLGDLPRLKSLCLENLLALEYIVEDEIRGQNSVRAKFPSLEKLELRSFPNLKGLLKGEEVGEMFPNLRSLHISNCELLILPALSTLEKLEARNCSLLTLSSFSKLENLSSLTLGIDWNTRACIPEDTLEGLPCNLKVLTVFNGVEHCLPEKWFRGLKSLTMLVIEYGYRASIPEGWLRHLTALEELRIFHRGELVELPEEIKYLHHLKRLQLWDLGKMVSLPQVLQHLPSLQSLRLGSLPQLTSLPEWLGNLTSLTRLEIAYCPRVPSLPSSIQGMTNLRNLEIWDCPQLKRRCEKGKGEDWHKIAHIPQLHII